MGQNAEVELLEGGNAIAVPFPGASHRRFHAIWLRDNAWDDATRAPATDKG